MPPRPGHAVSQTQSAAAGVQTGHCHADMKAVKVNVTSRCEMPDGSLTVPAYNFTCRSRQLVYFLPCGERSALDLRDKTRQKRVSVTRRRSFLSEVTRHEWIRFSRHQPALAVFVPTSRSPASALSELSGSHSRRVRETHAGVRLVLAA